MRIQADIHPIEAKMPWRELYILLFFILAFSTILITQFVLRGDYKLVNFDQILWIKMPDFLLPQNAQMTVCSTPLRTTKSHY